MCQKSVPGVAPAVVASEGGMCIAIWTELASPLVASEAILQMPSKRAQDFTTRTRHLSKMQCAACNSNLQIWPHERCLSAHRWSMQTVHTHGQCRDITHATTYGAPFLLALFWPFCVAILCQTRSVPMSVGTIVLLTTKRLCKHGQTRSVPMNNETTL